MTAQPDDTRKPRTGLRWPGILALMASLALLGGTAAWAHYTLINGAVVASGSVIVRGKPKSVQHLDGGVVEAIHVEDGHRVSAGSPLMKLDPTLLEANLKIYRTRYSNAAALLDRLEAEQFGQTEITFDDVDPLMAGLDQTEKRKGQLAIFNSRLQVQQGRREQLKEKVLQFQNQIGGTNTLIEAKQEQLQYIDRELGSIKKLTAQKLARESQVLAIQRSRADILGQIGEHRSELSRIANSIRDTELEMLQQERQFREEAVTALRDTQGTIEELTQQIISTSRQLDRVEIRAPVSGIVHETQFVTIGGVVPPGATILQIIPTDQGVTFETRIDPASIDQVHVGQPAKVMLSAFNQQSTPELKGLVHSVSADTVQDQATGQTFYRARISVSDEELARLGDLEIVPGMPVEAFLQTGERSVFSYLIKPISDQLQRAFREE